MAVSATYASAHGLTHEQSALVLAELEAILEGPSFSASKRCRDFLDFVVKGAIEGDYERLKERFLGVEIFGRRVDYETATDAIVRVRANDVRRRLAQHYSERHTNGGVVIGLAVGTYIPEFRWLAPQELVTAESSAASAQHSEVAHGDVATGEAVRSAARKFAAPLLIAVVLLFAVGILIASLLRKTEAPERALGQFWQPMFESKGPVTLRFGNTITYWISPTLRRSIESGPASIIVKPGEIMESWDDSASAGSIRTVLILSNLLSSHGIATRLRWPQEIQENELAHSSVIYIGAFNNSWTVSLNQNLRFEFEEADTPHGHVWMIRDHKFQDRKWSMTETYPQPINREYALITRILDPERKRVVISLGGLNQFGSQAAAEFLTDADAFDAFARSAPKGWQKRNLQIVMEMGISGNRAVNPRIIASNVW